MRRFVFFVSLGIVIVGAGMQASVHGQEGRSVGQARLSGDNEVPPVDAKGRGQASIFIKPAASEIDFRVTVTNVADMTQAHIHCGPAGVNGPVVAFLFGFLPGGSTLNGVLASGTITENQIIPRPDSAACPGGVGGLDDLLAHIASGNAYVNVHTIANPGGEIRGQIVAH